MFEKLQTGEKIHDAPRQPRTCSHSIYARMLTGVCQAIRTFSPCFFCYISIHVIVYAYTFIIIIFVFVHVCVCIYAGSHTFQHPEYFTRHENFFSTQHPNSGNLEALLFSVPLERLSVRKGLFQVLATFNSLVILPRG